METNGGEGRGEKRRAEGLGEGEGGGGRGPRQVGLGRDVAVRQLHDREEGNGSRNPGQCPRGGADLCPWDAWQ